MAPSWIQILIVVVLLVLLFGRGKISDLMGDVAKGIKSFKKGIAEDEEQEGTESAKSAKKAKAS
jgi:sec-independent protein translocase protein TatA